MRVKLPKHGAVPVALLLEPDLTLSDLKVYTALASFQGSNDDAFPSRDAIVERCGCALETVSRAVGHLIEMGWIQRVRRPNQSSIYRVLVESEEASEVTAPSQPESFGSDRPITTEVTAPSLPSIKQKKHSKKTTVVKQVDALYKPILESFLSKGNFADYKKEGTCIHAIIKKIRNLTPDTADETARMLLETFLTLTSGNDKFWKDRPFLPSALSPVLEQVWTIAKKGSAVPSMDWFDELERQRA
jgi:hypothetical protein